MLLFQYFSFGNHGMNHGVGSTDHFSALKIWMFENKFVSLLSHLKTIEPMEVHRESRTMCNTETSKVISRTDPVMVVEHSNLTWHLYPYLITLQI